MLERKRKLSPHTKYFALYELMTCIYTPHFPITFTNASKHRNKIQIIVVPTRQVKPYSTDNSVRRDFNPIVTTVCLFCLTMHKHLHQRYLEHLVVFCIFEVNILNAIKLWVRLSCINNFRILCIFFCIYKR